MTKADALNPLITEIHVGQCKQRIGPRGSITVVSSNVRRNGKPIIYKTRPDDWRVPIKFGLRDYLFITAANMHEFHVAADCPLAQPAMVRERELAESKKHVGTILLRLARPLKPAQRRKLFALSPDDKLTIATHAFPEVAAQILIEGVQK